MRKLLKTFASILTISLMFGCATNAPLETLYYKAEDNVSQKKMLIFLRGRGGSHEDFATKGFIHDVKVRNLPFDMAAPDAHFGYYFGETLVSRLKADIIEPAKEQGYETFWLVGVSMGGLGALMYTRQYPEDVEGVYLISPFLGYDKIINEIIDAGGVFKWSPGDYDPNEDWQRMLWQWIKKCEGNENPLTNLYLGYGTEDSFATAHELLGSCLPSDHLFSTVGGHTPEVMKKVWEIFLEKDLMN